MTSFLFVPFHTSARRTYAPSSRSFIACRPAVCISHMFSGSSLTRGQTVRPADLNHRPLYASSLRPSCTDIGVKSRSQFARLDQQSRSPTAVRSAPDWQHAMRAADTALWTPTQIAQWLFAFVSGLPFWVGGAALLLLEFAKRYVKISPVSIPTPSPFSGGWHVLCPIRLTCASWRLFRG